MGKSIGFDVDRKHTVFLSPSMWSARTTAEPNSAIKQSSFVSKRQARADHRLSRGGPK